MEDVVRIIDQDLRIFSIKEEQQHKELLNNAQQETATEMEEMIGVVEELKTYSGSIIANGEKRLSAEISRMQHEIEDLEDANRELEHTIINEWNKHLLNYKRICTNYYDAQNAYTKTGKGKEAMDRLAKEKQQEISKIRTEIVKFEADYSTEKGYDKQTNKWAKIAVDHHFDIVQIKVDHEINREYRIAKMNGIKSQKEIPPLSSSKKQKTIYIDLKPE